MFIYFRKTQMIALVCGWKNTQYTQSCCIGSTAYIKDTVIVTGCRCKHKTAALITMIHSGKE